MVFDGIVPVFTHTPPTTERASITTTRFFIFEAATAARWPLGPEPMIARSYFTALMRIGLPLPAFTPAFMTGIADTLHRERQDSAAHPPPLLPVLPQPDLLDHSSQLACQARHLLHRRH